MQFNYKIFERLAKKFSETNTKVSIFIPTNRVGDGQAAKIRFKNQLSEVVDKLMDETIQQEPMNRHEALAYTAKAYELLDREDFWHRQSDGLVVFLSEEVFEYYTMPIDFTPFNYVGNVFYLRHLLPAITDKSKFFVLALSQNEVRFFEGMKHSITPIIINDLVPASLEESLATIDMTYPSEFQAHSSGNNPIYHGQGGEKDGKTDRIIDYFRMIDEGLMQMLHDENAPLIIAAVDYLVPMYKEISNYSNIVETHISGNVENDDPILLHEKACEALKSILGKDFQEKHQTFSALLPQEKADLSINSIAPAALNGKIDTLFIDKNATPLFGTYHEKSNTVAIQKEQNKINACLLNFAAISTYLQGGTVYNVTKEKMPHTVSPMNAIYRY